MTKQTISIDIDDVIANSTESLRMLVNERTGANLTIEDYLNVGGEYWGYYERVWRTHGLQDQINFKDLSDEMIHDQSHVPLLPGAEFAIHELSKRFHVIFVTARDQSWEAATRKWFSQQFNHDDIELYFSESHKNSRAKTKGQLCRELGVTIHIDDNVSHCQSVLSEGIGAILFGHYGWHANIPSDVIRCKDWPSVLEYLNGATR